MEIQQKCTGCRKEDFFFFKQEPTGENIRGPELRQKRRSPEEKKREKEKDHEVENKANKRNRGNLFIVFRSPKRFASKLFKAISKS